MNARISQRIARVQSPVIPVVAEWIAAHPGTISLGQGIVHFGPPPVVDAAVVAAAQNNGSALDRYGSVRGTNELLDHLAHKVSRENRLELAQQRLLVTAGSNMGFLNAVLAIADAGDEVILLTPYYFNHHMAIEMLGCRVVEVPTDARYQIDVQAVAAAITERTRAVVTISPNNPTGAVYSRRALTAINQLCRENGCFHISDEAYEYFTYAGAEHFSPGSLPDSAAHTISLFSFSKAYGMAGWRCGYMAIPQELETSVKKIQDTNLICPPMICQIAATAALEAGRSWAKIKIDPFEQVRAEVLEQLGQLGERCRVPQPDGAFYVLVQLETDCSDLDLVHALIRDFGVAVLPGSAFGVTDTCALRIAYGALALETVAEGMGRLKRGLRSLL